ncbi:MAG: efflux RND transporter periplasmic adaptor subunit [Elusimicrobia bacterium]|nr:efflux RND transporter periplasmic adaptor subunit [Elusimicrobiota bacterium]
MKRTLNTRNAAVVTLGVVLVGAGAFYGFKRYKKEPDAPAELAKVTKGDVELHFSDSGELKAKNAIDVASKVSGRVIEMTVDEGARVKKGDKLAVIQPGRSEAEHYQPFSVASPIDGIVMRYQQDGNYQQEGRVSKLGDYVTGLLESNTPTYLMTVADLRTLVVRMRISEMDILKLREDMSVNVTIDAIAGESFPAKVATVSPQAEKDQNNLKNFRVDIMLLKSDARIKPGMTARVDGLLQVHKGVLKIPLSAVFEEGPKQYGYQQVKGAAPKKTELKLGLRNETDAEVLGGAKEGEEYLTEKPVSAPKS